MSLQEKRPHEDSTKVIKTLVHQMKFVQIKKGASRHSYTKLQGY